MIEEDIVIDESPEEMGGQKDSAKQGLDKVSPKGIGKLDMVIAFDTTGSMSAYIGAVRYEVAELIPRLFKDNEDLRLGIVAFGDYCDMENAQEFGKAYQCIMPTDSENDLVKFIRESKDTHGGDADEFYELVLKKIVEETPWREGAERSVLLIADANPHPVGYSFRDRVENNDIDWREVAGKAAEQMIRIDTVRVSGATWYKELSAMTNGISVPFHSGFKTARLVEASIFSKGSEAARKRWDYMYESCEDEEMKEVFKAYKTERDRK